MASKTMVVLGVLLATILLISTQVAARELTEQQEEKINSAGVVDEKYGGGGYPGHGGGGYPGHGGGGGGYPGHGGGGGGYPGHGGGGGGYPGHGGGGGGGGGHCRYGCCGHGYYGGCKCCKTADEIPEADYLPETRN